MAVHRRARSTRLLVALLVAASLMTITLDFRGGESGPLAAIGRVGVGIVSPLQEAVSTIFRPIGNFFSTLANLGELKAENARLKTQLQEQQGGATQVADLQRENEELRRQLDLKRKLGINDTKGATVIAESVSNFEWAIVIDRGADDGVTLDMPVIAGEGLVGRVSKVQQTTSKVMLLIDPESSVAARLASTGETGLLVGRRQEDLRFELIDPSTQVKPGEQVLTSGYEGAIFPEGIPIGVVSEVLPSDIDLTKYVLVRPNVDFSALDNVLLVLPHGDVGEKGQ